MLSASINPWRYYPILSMLFFKTSTNRELCPNIWPSYLYCLTVTSFSHVLFVMVILSFSSVSLPDLFSRHVLFTPSFSDLYLSALFSRHICDHQVHKTQAGSASWTLALFIHCPNLSPMQLLNQVLSPQRRLPDGLLFVCRVQLSSYLLVYPRCPLHTPALLPSNLVSFV